MLNLLDLFGCAIKLMDLYSMKDFDLTIKLYQIPFAHNKITMSRCSYVVLSGDPEQSKALSRSVSLATPRSSIKQSRVSDNLVKQSIKQDSVLTLYNLQQEVKDTELRLQELQDLMIKEMKRLGDNEQSFTYKKMNAERKLLKKRVQELNHQHKDLCQRLNQSAIRKAKAELQTLDAKSRVSQKLSMTSKSKRTHSLHSSTISEHMNPQKSFRDSLKNSSVKNSPPSIKNSSIKKQMINDNVSQKSFYSKSKISQKSSRLSSQRKNEYFQNPESLKSISMKKKSSKEVCTQTGTQGVLKDQLKYLDTWEQDKLDSLRQRFEPSIIKHNQFDLPLAYSTNLDQRYSPERYPMRSLRSIYEKAHLGSIVPINQPLIEPHLYSSDPLIPIEQLQMYHSMDSYHKRSHFYY